MAKASEVVNRALSLLLVQPAEAPIEASEAQTAIEVLNDMMTEWDASGLPLGYTIVSTLGDAVTVPDSTLRAIKYNLAIALAPEFGKAPDPLLVSVANQSFEALQLQVVEILRPAFPSTLPLGSGNECTTDQRFFPGDAETFLLNEEDGALLLEDEPGA